MRYVSTYLLCATLCLTGCQSQLNEPCELGLSLVGSDLEVPLALSSREVLSGTWEVSFTGMLLESRRIQAARIPVTVPVGHTISGIRLRGIQTQPGSSVSVQLQSVTDDQEPEDLGPSGTTKDGCEGSAQDVVVDLEGRSAVVQPDARYFLRVEAVGGDALRQVTGAYVAYRP